MINVRELLGGCSRTDELTGEVLYELIEKRRPQLVVEIGTGNSTKCIAKALSDLGTGVLYTVDPSASGDRTMEELSKLGLRGHVVRIQKHSDYCRRDFRGKHIEVLFIDGDHCYNSVMSDWNTFITNMLLGDIIIFHDLHEVEVRRAFDELRLKGSLSYIEEDPPQPGVYTPSIGVVVL